jgi:hypothetical protein
MCSVIYRGVRIYKVLSYYEDYWNLMKQYGDDIDNSINQRASNFISKEEKKRLEKAKQWREPILIKMLGFYIALPLLAFTVIAFAIPYVYTIVPVYESNTCWQSFLDRTGPPSEGESGNLGMTLDVIPCSLRLINVVMFITLNWAEIIGFAVLFWLVRNIKNELSVKSEVQAVLLLWSSFSVVYFVV